jgi:hypothetical protein
LKKEAKVVKGKAAEKDIARLKALQEELERIQKV